MSAMPEATEKRRHPRVAVEGHLRYRKIPIGVKGPLNAQIRDIGLGGFRFRSEELLDRNANLLLEVHLPGAHPIRSLGMVAWVRAMPGDEGFEVGGTFVEPAVEVLTTLEQALTTYGLSGHA